MADARTLRRLERAGLRIEERPPRAGIALRGDPDDARFRRAVEAATSVALPLAPGSSASGLLASILCLGPDEWLAMSETQEAGWLESVRSALNGVAAAATDIGHARIVYAVAGSNARDALAKGCPLDLHERAFAVGRCAQSVLAKASVLIHRVSAEPVFEIHVARSLRDYAWDWLQAAASEYAPEPGAG